MEPQSGDVLTVSEALLRALVTSKGWRVILALCEGEKSRAQLMKVLELGKSTVHRALKKLTLVGLVEGSIAGYRATDDGKKVGNWLNRIEKLPMSQATMEAILKAERDIQSRAALTRLSRRERSR